MEHRPESRNISIKEVAKRLDKGVSTIWNKVNREHKNFDPTFPRPWREGGRTHFDEAEIEAWRQATREAGRF